MGLVTWKSNYSMAAGIPATYAAAMERMTISSDGEWEGTVGGDDVAEQTREALRRIESALGQAGASLGDVIRTRIFVTDIGRWREVGLAHGEFFGDIRPAATMVEVSALIDPALLVEIEVDAIMN